MNSKILTLLLFLSQFLFGSCTSKVSYNSQITNYDYRILDGCLIYNRDADMILFESFKTKGSGLVFVDKALRIVKKAKELSLTRQRDYEIYQGLQEIQLIILSCR